MLTVTITLGQLLILILIFFSIRFTWILLERKKWNHGVCTKCNKGNYIAIRHDMNFIGYECQNCNNETYLFFDKITNTEKYIYVGSIEYKKLIRKQKLKKLNL